MKAEDNKLYGLLTLSALLSALNIRENELNSAVMEGYNCFELVNNKNKSRPIEAPNKKLKKIQRVINKLLQELDCPEYVKYAWKGKGAYQNALSHIGQFSYITMDISRYFPNSKTKYIRDVYEKVLNIHGEALEYLLKLTTLGNHLPTGAPTSPILAYLAHKELFDEIYRYTCKKDIMYTLMADDITLSAKHGITREEVRYVAAVLGRHGLRLKKKKTKFYGYKLALITGFFIQQSGKISVPRFIGNTIVKILKTKPIAEMCIEELERLNAYINYERLVNKKAFFITHIKVIKRLKQLYKQENQQKKGI